MSDTSEQLEGVLDEIQTGIDVAEDKLESGRIRDEDKENIRLDYLDTLNRLAQTKVRIIVELYDIPR